ncbi:MAG: PilX N-terminal domain-containing pilus assembly protein [Candidatus Berkelbacteria bacterium]|nr:PilX N-terminal domain-containing pilus assembly protein [Candidatus Berkelbacteria bacterium]
MRKKGFALVTVLVLTTVLLILGIFFTNISFSELKISKSLRGGTQALYIAQAGVEEAIWKVKNDESYKSDFEHGTLNQTFSRNNVFNSQTSYEVQLNSLDKGQAEVISKGYYPLGNIKAARRIKVKFVKALNPNPSWDKVMYGSEDIELFASQANFNGGNLYAVHDITVWGGSIANVEKDALAKNNINVWLFSQLNVGGVKHSVNYPPPPEQIEMPQIDFDSDNPNSYLSKAAAAGTVYAEQEFKNMLKDQSPLTLNGIIYVKGAVDIKKRQSLTVNGTLVADGNVTVGLTALNPLTGEAYLTVNKPADGSPSGILTKGKIKIGVHATNTSINGLMYAMDEINLFNFSSSLTVVGGLIAREFNIFSVWQPTNITYDADRIQITLQQEPSYSPTIEVDYWEEEY